MLNSLGIFAEWARRRVHAARQVSSTWIDVNRRLHTLCVWCIAAPIPLGDVCNSDTGRSALTFAALV